MDDLALSLETPRLILRPLRLDDVDFIFKHFSDPLVTRHLLDEEPMVKREEAVELFEFFQDMAGKTYKRWGILHKEDGVLIGTCGFHKWDQRRFHAEVGYDLSAQYWGRGLMVEALQAMLKYGFERMQLNRVEALVYVENPQSVHVLEKLGFQREGVLREYFYRNGQFFDHFIYSLLKREWTGNPRRA
ncbi:MAG: GNAT family N-acetyltransferase [Chloroflexi bacterium]|nr:GNAT family N-acetyltransferase [Chloroflexota bacterium]